MNNNIVIRFAGDSGDGIQAMGERFTLETALKKNGLTTFPDYPAEIRAPQGTTFGVSAFQIHMANHKVLTAGDQLDVLVAFNPAALKVNIRDLRPGGLLILDQDSFNDSSLLKANYDCNPLTDNSLEAFQIFSPAIERLVAESVKDIPGLSRKHIKRAKNMWILGVVLWLYERDCSTTKLWINTRFYHQESIKQANLRALDAGHAFAEISEFTTYPIPPVQNEYSVGSYRLLKGSDALALGLITGSYLLHRSVLFCSYPITPASSLLHAVAAIEKHGITAFQTEDEIAAICAAIGASYAGSIGVTASSGPGLSLKSEALGLAISAELPLLVIVAQRGGPSTGLPTKTEQSDLWQAVFGRHGDTFLPVLAAQSPGDCFTILIESMYIAIRYMTPVVLLTDGYLQNTSEPWRIPEIENLQDLYPEINSMICNQKKYYPSRDQETLARAWIVPGTKDMVHCIGGLEKDYFTGYVSYDSKNHEMMTDIRQKKILNITNILPEQMIEIGPKKGKLVVVSWGSTFGVVKCAVSAFSNVSHVHLRYLYPFPKNLTSLLKHFEQLLIVEMNTGQLHLLLESFLKRTCLLFTQTTGKPFKVSSLQDKIRQLI